MRWVWKDNGHGRAVEAMFSGQMERRTEVVTCRACGSRLGTVVGPSQLDSALWKPKLTQKSLPDIWWFDAGMTAWDATGHDILHNSESFEWRVEWKCTCGAHPQIRLAKLGPLWERGGGIEL